MESRKGVFAGDDPFALARQWLTEAEKTELNDPNAVALATVDGQGMPNVRMVLLKAIEDDAMVFFTNYQSAKGVEIDGAGKAALCFHWKTLRRQVRVRGQAVRETADKSDAYYNSRALGSRIGAWASQQSQPLASKADLIKSVARAQIKQGLSPDRPPFWGGFRVLPLEFEFWADGEFRLHDRFRWTRGSTDEGWEISRLYP